MSKFIEGMIECPFYLREGEGFIACEGIITGSSCHHRFENDFQKRNYEIDVCSTNGGKKCRYYRTMALLYERGLKA
ncbi:MAG: hypothetical protein J6D06_05180 [Clostridia bacterium]|nr:hypothetical protein [Clostridia bacterium]